MKPSGVNIRSLDREELGRYFEQIGEKPFRTQQVLEWIWKKHASGFGEMTNLSRNLRDRLALDFTFPILRIAQTQKSSDGTLKNRFLLYDGNSVEGVLIPTTSRITACVSSQVGCSLNCAFCATGYLGRKRNLEFDEIYQEVVQLNLQSNAVYNKKISNIVFMGMGEPLLNYHSVARAIERIIDPEGLGISPRRITLSTAGVAKMIRQLGEDQVRFNLALSLHAANDRKRSRIMPINETNHLKSLTEALNHFFTLTQNDITLEYILFQDFNDTLQDAEELIRIYRRIPVKVVNLIEYNPIGRAEFQKPEEPVVQRFIEYLDRNQVNVRLRRSRGRDIDAACGQLANIPHPESEIPDLLARE